MKPWSEVEASPDFQALPDFDKSRAQSQYFDEVVAPQVGAQDLEVARGEFFDQFKRSYLPADSGQSQGSSAVNAGLQALAKVGTGTVEGLGKFGESYVRNLNPIGLAAQTGLVPGLQSVVDTYASVPSTIAGGADTAQKAVEEVAPVNPLYQDTMPVKATGTAGQVAGQLATVLTGAAWTKAPRVLQALGLGQAATMGIDSGYDEADRLGVTNPWQRDALALSYAASEAGMEGMGGFGSKPFVQALTGQIRETLMPSLVRGARTAVAEGLEEPITGTAQAVASNVFGNEDPARPGYALNGQPLPTVDPTSAEFWKQRGEETLYGTLAGGLFAGAQFAGSRPKVDEMKKLQQKAALTIEAMQNKPDITEDEAADLEDLKREEANLSTMIRTSEAPPTTNIAVEATKMAAQTAAKADLPATAKQLEILQGLLSTEAPAMEDQPIEEEAPAAPVQEPNIPENEVPAEAAVPAPPVEQAVQLPPEEQFSQLNAEREDLAQRRTTLQQIPRDQWEEPEIQFDAQLQEREQANAAATEGLRAQRPDLFPVEQAVPTMEESAAATVPEVSPVQTSVPTEAQQEAAWLASPEFQQAEELAASGNVEAAEALEATFREKQAQTPPKTEIAPAAPEIKNSRPVELNVITKRGLAKETVEATPEIKQALIERVKQYTKLLNCLNS